VHNYQKKLFQMIEDGEISAEAGALRDVDIRHDDWCRALRGAGECNCEPDIKVRPIRESSSVRNE
jgi:hypothetical protein